MMDPEYEESLKFAALRKLKKVNHLINEITIGPNSISKIKISETPKPTTPDKVVGAPSKSHESSPVSEGLPKRQFLKLLDLERQEKYKNALNERLERFEKFRVAQEEQSKQLWLRAQQSFIEDMERQEMYILEANQQYDLKQASQHAKMAELTQNAMHRMKERQQFLRERERQRQILSENVNRIKANQQKFSSEYQQILVLFKGCRDNVELRNSKDLDLSLLKSLPSDIEAIVEKCKGDNVSSIAEEDVKKTDEVVSKVIDFRNKFKAVVDSINERKQQNQKLVDQVKEQEKSIPATQVVAKQPPSVPPLSSAPLASVPAVNNSSDFDQNKANIVERSKIIKKYVNVSDLETYTALLFFHDELKKKFVQIESDSNLKMFKNDCRKAVNIPVNSLSGANPEHILDKYHKLHRLLKGQPVMVSNQQINASRHPYGVPFCMDLLAKQLVLQGDLIVSSNPESAFCYASVILSLWNDFPDFGKLILAHFYKTCPYLVPYYIPKQEGDSDEQFYAKLGYKYIDGEVEEQNKFLKRMAGIMKLYFAILISKPKRGQNVSPYNLKCGWKWLASFLKLQPRLDISATAMHVFLETIGFEMHARYGRMFEKILAIIIQVFLPKCKEASCTGGAVTRLELLLNEYIKNRKFEKPNGYVEYAYW